MFRACAMHMRIFCDSFRRGHSSPSACQGDLLADPAEGTLFEAGDLRLRYADFSRNFGLGLALEVP